MLFLVFFMHAMLAAIFPIGRVAVEIAQPLFFTAIRMIMAACFLLLYQFLRYRTIWPQFEKKYVKNILWQLILLAVFNIFVTNVFEIWALQFIPAAKASFLYSITPFCAALFSYFLLNEKLTLLKLAGMSISLFGFMLMIIYQAPQEEIIGGIGYLSWAEMAIFLSAMATAFGWLVMRKLLRSQQCSALEANAWSMMGGGILSLLVSFLFESWNPVPTSDWMLFLIYISLAVICSNLIGYTLYGVLLRTYTSTFLSLAGFIEPLAAAFYGWIFLGEIVTARFFAASVIVFAGLYLFYREELKQGYIVKKK